MNYQGRRRFNRGGRGPPRRINSRSFGREMEKDLEGEEATATSPTTFQTRNTNLLHTPKGKQNTATCASTKEKVIQYAQEHLKYGHDMVPQTRTVDWHQRRGTT
jgi:hypothetical protein